MEEEYLKKILEKIRTRIQELNISIEEGEKDIEKMNDYYWSSYSEMDEYGYENYDNQQALLTQINANSQALDYKRRFLKMLDSPYFGRIDFVYEGEDQAESYYIGIGNFSEGAGNTPLIVDWRAPVSSVFYDYDKGPASFETPQGVQEGELVSKWQYKIKNGKMVYSFESDVKIDDEILKNELGKNGDVKLKNIVRTIQREQNEIIRNIKDRILVVQGAAGSGKTSIALHRIAYLLYHERKNLKASDILILSPNSVFADYIAHILPELGEENICEMGFDIFAYRELKGVVNDCEEKFDQIERMLKIESDEIYDEEEVRNNYRYKQSEEFVREINGYVLELESELVDFRDVHFKFLHKSAAEIMELFYSKFPDVPLLTRMDVVAEYVIDEAETLNGKSFDELELEIVKEKFRRMYRTRDIYTLYSDFLEDRDLGKLMDVPVEERKLRYEDVFPMLYLKYQLLENKKRRPMKHLVIDEMQDYTYIQYVLLQKLFQCKMTIVGDRAQTMEDAQMDIMKFMPKIFGKDIRMISIGKSYRQTVENATYAAGIIGDTGVELLDRHGKKPEVYRDVLREDALDQICDRIGASLNRYETFAVITMTEEEAKYAAEQLTDRLNRRGMEGNKMLHYIERNSREFHKGITVTTFYLAKGLEFDQVHGLYEGGNMKPLHKQAKYIIATRALHELYMYEIDKKQK
ncbi:MAG: HelD family protein [Lachnospiraceae bacterium]